MVERSQQVLLPCGSCGAGRSTQVDGDRLLHTDLHGDQFLLGADGAVQVIDWGFPGAGAPWVDAAFLALRLVEAGHHPDDAEDWARSLTCWSGVDYETLTAFAVYVAGMWSYWTPHR